VRARLILALLPLTAVACATPSLYEWGDYEADMYKAYKSPDDEVEFEETLVVIMNRAQKKGTRVPPGIYAEYAYQLFEENKLGEAIVYLQKESEAWPESTALMVRLIAAVEREEERREGGGEPDAALAWAVEPSDGIAEDAAQPVPEAAVEETSP
jgi:hypothetical protein